MSAAPVLQNYWNVNLSPGDPGYDSRPWIRSDDATHPSTLYVGQGGVRKRCLLLVGQGGEWKPLFDTEPDYGPDTIIKVSHCNADPATSHPPTYGAQATFVCVGNGVTLQIQTQWTIDGVDYLGVDTHTTGPGFRDPFDTGASSTPVTAGTGVDDGSNHVWTFTYRIQKLDTTWTSWTAAGSSVTTSWQACGRPS